MATAADPELRRSPQEAGTLKVVVTLVSLKARLLLGGIRAGGTQRLQTIWSFLIAIIMGTLGAMVISVVARSDGSGAGAAGGAGSGSGWVDDLLVVGFPAVVAAMVLFASATGVDSTIDARRLASEPLGRTRLTLGLLAAAALGPAGVLAVLAGVGVTRGWWPDSGTAAVVVLVAVAAMLVTLLLATRTAANLLGAVATGQWVQVAQSLATLAALLGWLATQLLARDTSGWTEQRWERLAGIAKFTPPGQLALAITESSDLSAASLHLLLGVLWLPLLVWLNSISTVRLALSSPRAGGESRPRPSRLRSGAFLDRITPNTPAGALARRTVVTRLRSPRQAVNTFTALALGGGAFLIVPILGNGVDARIVIVGGMLHFAVLFDGNNAFGYDGTPIWVEVAAGADASTLVRGKVLASWLVMAPAAVVLPVVLAAMTGGWQWIPAGWLVAAGSLLGASGVAVASAALAPVAMPDSPNPLAAGDTGQGCIAGLMLGTCMLVLAVASAPVAAVIYLVSANSATTGTLASLLAVPVGALVLVAGVQVARLRISGSEAELVERVTLGR